MKQLNQWVKRKKFQVMAVMTTFTFIYLPKIAYADARSDAQAKLKNGFSDAINAFTNVFQYLAYGVGVLAFILIGISGMIIHDEQSIKNTKRMATYVMIIAFLVGVSATLITLATNKTK